MASPPAGFELSSPALDQWRAEKGERLTYSEVGWAGASVAIVAHASIHFFSVALPPLERLLAVFGPPERLAFGLTEGVSNRIATWLLLLVAVGTWGALIGVAALSAAHEATDALRRLFRRPSASGDRAQGASPPSDPAAFPGRYSPEPP